MSEFTEKARGECEPISGVSDSEVDLAARALERYLTQQYEWTDEQFEIWWNKDPFFVEQVRCWGHFTGTNKEYLLHKVRLVLEAAKGCAQ